MTIFSESFEKRIAEFKNFYHDFLEKKAASENTDLNEELEQRVRNKAEQLEESFRQLHKEEKKREIAEERARIMRDMHDGVGGHLIGMLNRFDETIVFHRLEPKQLRHIVDIQLERFSKRVAERDITLKISNAAREFLAQVSYDPAYGARPLRRAIQTHLLDNVNISQPLTCTAV